MEFRNPTADELRLLTVLSTIARLEDPDAWVGSLRVRDMSDGGMGSLELDVTRPKRGGSIICLAAVQFTDSDGIEVIASLNGTEERVPFEVDVWKTDFSPLRSIATHFRPLPPE